MPDPALSSTIYAVLKPEIQKIREFRVFAEKAVAVFTEEFDSLVNSEKKKELSSSLHLRSVISLLDALATLDALMAMKACLNNNFSRYKRYFPVGLCTLYSVFLLRYLFAK